MQVLRVCLPILSRENSGCGFQRLGVWCEVKCLRSKMMPFIIIVLIGKRNDIHNISTKHIKEIYDMKPTRISNKNMATDSRKGKPELSSGNGSSFTPN